MPPAPKQREAPMQDLRDSARVYAQLAKHATLWSLSTLWRLLLARPHPQRWSVTEDFNVMLLHTLFEEGNYKHWRSAVTIWLAMHPPADEGLQLVRVPAGTIAQGVEEGARDSFWVSLPKDAAAKCPPPQASCVIMYLHGGSWMAGDTLQYVPAMRLWLEELAKEGVSARILSVGYPLAPEHPFPAAVLYTAAVYKWLSRRGAAQAKNEKIILAGDSAGGNLVLAALAYLRDGAGKSSSSTGDSAPAPAPALARKSGDGASSSKRRSSGGGSKRSSGAAGAAADASAAAAKHSWQPPAAAVLISPAVDLSSKSVFGPALARHFRQRKEQQQLEEQRALERQQRRQRQKQQQQQQQQQEQQGEEAEQAGSGDAAGAQEQAPRQQPRGPSLPLRSGQQQEAQGPVQLLSGKVVLPRVSQAADACVDYVCTGEGIAAADLYVRADEPAQLLDPLVSPLQLASFGGLVEKEWLVVWGAVEMMAPDIARLVAKMQQDPAGVAVQAHVGELRVHAFPVLTYSRRLMEEGAAAIVPFIVDVVLEEGDYVRV